MRHRARWQHARLFRWVVLACVSCATAPLPDPRSVAQSWARAVEHGDANAAQALLDERGRRAHGQKGVAESLRQHRKELLETARATTSSGARLETTATVSFRDDRAARVVVEEGRYRIAAAGAFPAAAVTPLDAIRELREVLRRRSFAGLSRVLSRDTGRTLEAGVQDLVNALDEPSTLDIDVEGRRAVARLPGGQQIELVREDGVWRVKDID